jgi:aromatic ring-cleaving dioxygenase
MADVEAPYHAHVYCTQEQRPAAERLRTAFRAAPGVLFVGRLTEGKAGPHPIPQFEIHFLQGSLPGVIARIEESGLRTLVHPLTDDDMADHTSLARWIGDPIELDLTVLDAPGRNQGVARFGKADFQAVSTSDAATGGVC